MLRSPGELGTVLGIWAHPDDEAYLSGGLMADIVEQGGRVICVTATRGEAGFGDDDTRTVDERMAIRTAELDACLAVLGVRDHHWLGYPDGACAEVTEDEPVAKLTEVLNDVKPETVLTFGPDGMTRHRDHIAVGRWATMACARADQGPARLLYATKVAAWNELFAATVAPASTMMEEEILPPETDPDALAAWFQFEHHALERKVTALERQASQTAPLMADLGPAMFRTLIADEYFREPSPGDHTGTVERDGR